MLWQRFERKFSTVTQLLRAAFLIVDYAKFVVHLKKYNPVNTCTRNLFFKKMKK